jgi:hypothetical protein
MEIIIKNFKNKRINFYNVSSMERADDEYGTQLGWVKTHNQN